MKKAVSLFFFICVLLSGMSAQKEIQIDKYKVSEVILLQNPVLIDSFNVEKSEFSDKDFLQTQVDFNKVRKSKKILAAKAQGIIPLEFTKFKKGIQLLSFYIDAERYSKAKLEVTSTEMFEIYINGKKEKSKLTKEDSLSRSASIDLSLNLEPGRYEVIIKRLAYFKNFNESELKAVLKPDNKSSLSRVSFSVDEKRFITINDILEGNRVTDGKISPSGKYYVVSFEDVLAGGTRSEFYELRELKDNRLIYSFPSNIRPYWMPSSDRLYYWKSGQKDDDFYLFDAVSLKEEVSCKGIKPVSFKISPDESFMLVHQKMNISVESGSLKRTLSPSDRVGTYRSRHAIYKYNFKQEILEQITFGKTDTYATDISFDGKKILFMTSEEDLSQRLFYKFALYLLDVETEKVDTLVNDRFISNAIFSPDGKKVLIKGSGEAFGGIGQNILANEISNAYDDQAFILDLSTKAITPITKNFNPSISRFEWSKLDGKIYFEVEEEDRELVYAYDPKTEKFDRLDLKEDVIANFNMAVNVPFALYRGQSVANPNRLYSIDLKSKQVTMLADPYKERLDAIAMGKVEDWSFTSSGGTTIKGRYYLPPNFDPAKKYPMIVYYYAGTTPTLRLFDSRYPLNVYAALGYVVYTLQPSGTIGFGQEFAARHVNAWGEPAASEIIEGTKKFCETHTFVDNKKIACIGASYGGFMTQYILTKTDIFAAAVSHAGISALSSYWGEGYWGYSYSGTASANSFPWNNPKLYVDQSPLFHADKINTPLLLLHGSADTNVPIGESIQMYNALKLLGKTVEFIQVEGENHAISAYQKRLDWNKTIYSWFAKWLQDQSEWWNNIYPDKNL